MKLFITENEKKHIHSLYNLTEQLFITSYSDKECYKEFPNLKIEGLKNFLISVPDFIKKLQISNTSASTSSLASLSRIICVLNQTLYSLYNNKWQKEIDKKLYLDIFNLIQSKISGLLTFASGINKLRERYNNFKSLIETVYK